MLSFLDKVGNYCWDLGELGEVALGYKAIGIVGFNAKHCVVIKFCINSRFFYGRYYPFLFLTLSMLYTPFFL